MNRQSQIFATGLGLAMAAASAAQAAPGDRQVYEAAIARASRVCPDHSPERTGPGIKGIPVAALRVIEQRNYTLCPDRRLDSQTPVVWYGREGVFAWNPAARGSAKLLAGKAAAYAKDQSFPSQTVVWKPNGKLAEGALVPAFRGRMVR
ncbi:hypothetical protein [Lysobacter sp. 1R34A]|uniref:hypothetical protein n=1 Tax=Lysobacter sp. 1R34A TaxID=3445786 RepID=UPI003EEDED0B